MNVAPDAPTRPALRYYGGKFDLSRWIVAHLPEHDHYVEPCFGAGSVLLAKPAVKLETVNDLNGRVVNYFQVLRDDSAALIRSLELTPWAQDEYTASKIISNDPIEEARRFHLQCWMSINGGPVATGFRVQNTLESRYATPATDLLRHDLWTVARRLKNVQILNEGAIRCISRYKTAADALIYFDPPYVRGTRTFSGYGDFEVCDDFHAESAAILRTLPGMVVVSGYACPLYAELYEAHGWARIDNESTQTNTGGSRIESLWLSPRTADALAKPAQAAMFV